MNLQAYIEHVQKMPPGNGKRNATLDKMKCLTTKKDMDVLHDSVWPGMDKKGIRNLYLDLFVKPCVCPEVFKDWLIGRIIQDESDVLHVANVLGSYRGIHALLTHTTSHYSAAQFKSSFINPVHVSPEIKCPYPNLYLHIYAFYLQRYQIDLLSDIATYPIATQGELLVKWVKNQGFHTPDDYGSLRSHIHGFPSDLKDEIHLAVLSHENRPVLFDLFKDDFRRLMETAKARHVHWIFKSNEKTHHVMRHHLQGLSDQGFFNRAMDYALVHNQRQRPEFVALVEQWLEMHLQGDMVLRPEAFCIIAKRCQDFGFFELRQKMVDTLVSQDPGMLKKIHEVFKNNPLLEINSHTTLNLGQDAMRKFSVYVQCLYLEQALPEKENSVVYRLKL